MCEFVHLVYQIFTNPESMPSIKPVLKNDFVKTDGKSKIYFRIYHNGKLKYLPSVWYIEPKYMGDDGRIKSNYPTQSTLNGALLQQLTNYNKVVEGIGPNVKDLTIDQLVIKLTASADGEADFFLFTNNRIDTLAKERRYSLAELYSVTLKHLKAYTEKETLSFKEITPVFLESFENHLKKNGSSVNTVRNYMCNIRAIFNHAINKAEVIKLDIFPFRKYKIMQEKKRPRAIDINDLKRLLMAYEYFTPAVKRDVDIFFLILYTGGTNLKDLLYLKKCDYYKGRIIYNRFKTGREYSIKIFPEAKAILERYQGGEYLLKFIEKKIAIHKESRKGYENKDLLRTANKNLKLAGEACGIKLRLSTYVARYTFATVAGDLEIMKDVISHILGHGENTMTDLYIDFDEKKADEAIKKVIDAVKLT